MKLSMRKLTKGITVCVQIFAHTHTPALQPGRTSEKVLPALHPTVLHLCTAQVCPAAAPQPQGRVSPSAAASHGSGTNP